MLYNTGNRGETAMEFYTYTYLRTDRSPYYVGKGKNGRVYVFSSGHWPPKDRSRILIQYWPDEATAFAYEMYQIDFWGRKDLGTGILRNLTDGGEGNSGGKSCLGTKRTAEFKKAQSERFKGEKNPNFGKKTSAITRSKMSDSHRGKKNWAYGIVRSKSHRANLSKSLKKGFEQGRVNPSQGKTGKNSYMFGRVWINDGTRSKRILGMEVEHFLTTGWKRGRKVNRETQQLRISRL